jgi:CelD/BcsL family acetyltransferase involved in cellulose biosynthesis
VIDDNLKIETVRRIEEIEKVRSIWERMQADESYPKINADIDRYLTSLKATSDNTEPYIMVVREDGRPAAMLISRVEKSHLKCAIGRKTLFEPALRQLSIVYGGVIGNATDEICRLLIGELMKVLRRGEIDVVFLNHLEADSSLYKVARKMPGLFYRGHFSKVEQHWCMSIPEDMDQFWKACSPNRRKKLRRYVRNLEKEYPGQVRAITYSKEDEVAEAIEIAADISANTYQRAFGGGLVNDATTRVFFETAARKGWLRIDILFVGDEPCVFSTAMRYGRTFFAELTGYSPEWRDWNVGSILFLKIVERLCGDPSVNLVDLGIGPGLHKQWGDSRQWPETSVFIFAPRLFPVFVNLTQSSTLAISVLVQRLISRLGIPNLVQRYRRGRILRKRSQAEPQSIRAVTDLSECKKSGEVTSNAGADPRR